MDPLKNPFAPGAGSQPPELAGRDDILEQADIALQRILLGRQDRSRMLLGLRGVGKTVLLNQIERTAELRGHLTSFLEAPEDDSLARTLYPQMAGVLRRLSAIESAKARVLAAMRALRGFSIAFQAGSLEIALPADPEPGVADSGMLESDLADLFIRIGEAAQSAGKAWTLLIDEIQYLRNEELAAVIVALHRASQRGLPILFFGAGLPQVAKLSGEAKSYAERLFSFISVGALGRDPASRAIVEPICAEGERITGAAVDRIIQETRGYPYFLQEWGFQTWKLAEASPIPETVVTAATKASLAHLDGGFFRVRYESLTPGEREYVKAMAQFGPGPCKTAAVAEAMGEKITALAPRRAGVVKKGIVYSPSHGEIDFTVPLFNEFIRRTAS
ncbi:MAG: ATP-binding protein [Gammaproteobacteria bacterium]|nr:ATP-binding protein [Gammaproteobacteria bacterium]MCY4183316.1 ATP-binding protein [Gammaproteobacteria bacterium]MCY4270615.1 ATP-binding protein [Gammaproteobacteria bacterium]